MKKKRSLHLLSSLLLLSFLVATNTSFGQYIIEGQVTDDSKSPLIGCNLLVYGTFNGTVGDIDGKFRLEVDSLPVNLEISYVGYLTQNIEVNSTEFLNIELEENIDGISHCPVIVNFPKHWAKSRPAHYLYTPELSLDNEVSSTAALNRIPGIHMQSGALNTNRLTIRGIGNRSPFSTRKIRAYFEGIPLTDGSGESAIEDIDMSLISSIDIKKGPTGGNHGAGLGGVIILNAKGSNGIPPRTSISSKTTIGSYGLFRNSTTFQLPFMDDEKSYNKKHSLYVNYNRTHSDGYRTNNEYDRTGLGLVAQLGAETNYAVTLLMNYTKGKAFIPSSLDLFQYQNNPTVAPASWASIKGNEDYEKINLGLSKVFFIADNDKIVLANQTSLFTRFRTNDELRPFNFLQENSNIIGIRSIFKLENKMDFGLKLGLEGLSENITWSTFEGVGGTQINSNIEDRRYLNLFSTAEGNFNSKLSWELGVNLNKTKYQYRDNSFNVPSLAQQQAFDWILSPNVGLNYRLPFAINYLFVNAAHGFSPPSLEETLLPDGARNLNIRPETGWNYELGWRGTMNNFSYETSIYHMLIDDLLVAKRIDEDQFQGINAGKTRHSGFEAALKHSKYFKKQSIRSFLNYSYSNYQFIDFVDGDNDYSGNELTGQAPHQVDAGLLYSYDDSWYGNLLYRYVDGFPIRDDNSIYSDAYQLVNLKLGYKLDVDQKWYFDFYFGLNNLLNEKYASQILINASSFGGNAPRYYYPGLPRNFYTGVSVRYSFETE